MRAHCKQHCALFSVHFIDTWLAKLVEIVCSKALHSILLPGTYKWGEVGALIHGGGGGANNRTYYSLFVNGPVPGGTYKWGEGG